MSFGLTAKERMAQLQSKSAKDAPPPKAAPGNAVKKPGNNTAKPATDAATKDAPKLNEAKKPETKDAPKPEPKKPDAAKPSPGDASKPQASKKDELKPTEAQKPEPKEPEKPKDEAKKPEVKDAAKPTEQAQPKEEAKKPEMSKSKEEPPKPEPLKPDVKPKEEAKAPEPAKPKEEPKTTEAKPATEPPKPAEQQKAPEPAKTEAKVTEAKPADKLEATPAATKQPEKPKEEAKPVAPAKPKEEPPKPAEAKPPAEKAKVDEKKPAEPPKPAPQEQVKPTATEPAKPAAGKPAAEGDTKKTEQPKTDLFRSIFYFHGMGTLLGSALAEGVYVPESGQKTALDADAVESASAKRRAINKTEQMVITARNQAQALSTDFRNLQSLLESVPTFGEPLQAQPLDRRGVDQPIHGHVYFQQSDHIPLQTPPSRHGRAHVVPEVSHEAHISATYTTSVQQRYPGAKQVLPSAAVAHPHPAAAAEMHVVPQQQQPPTRPYSDQQPPPQSRSPHFDQHPVRPSAHDRAALSHADYGLEAPSQPWQDRYARGSAQAADAARSPRPFGADVDAGGIKPWQMSHVRGLEAKGYRLVTEPEHDVDSSSYAPYLVSDRTFNVDRRGKEQHQPSASSSFGVHQPAFRPPSTCATYPFAPAIESTMPYCDL